MPVDIAIPSLGNNDGTFRNKIYLLNTTTHNVETRLKKDLIGWEVGSENENGMMKRLRAVKNPDSGSSAIGKSAKGLGVLGVFLKGQVI